jgi:hypothetical protein
VILSFKSSTESAYISSLPAPAASSSFGSPSFGYPSFCSPSLGSYGFASPSASP